MRDLEIVVDTRERYAYKFTAQQATTRKAPLRAGDYAVHLDGDTVGAVERKSVDEWTYRFLAATYAEAVGDRRFGDHHQQ